MTAISHPTVNSGPVAESEILENFNFFNIKIVGNQSELVQSSNSNYLRFAKSDIRLSNTKYCFFYITTYIFRIAINNLISLRVSNILYFCPGPIFGKYILIQSTQIFDFLWITKPFRTFDILSLAITAVFLRLSLIF